MLYALSAKTPFIGLLCSNNVSLFALLNDYLEVKLKHLIFNLLKDLAHLTSISGDTQKKCEQLDVSSSKECAPQRMPFHTARVFPG